MIYVRSDWEADHVRRNGNLKLFLEPLESQNHWGSSLVPCDQPHPKVKITPTKTIFFLKQACIPHPPNPDDFFLQKRRFFQRFFFPPGFCGNHDHFLKAVLEDSHPVMRQNAAGALARKLKHRNCGMLQGMRNS